MKTRSGFVQGCNAQAVVTKEQIIIAVDITQEENDVWQLHPMLNQAQHNKIAIKHDAVWFGKLGQTIFTFDLSEKIFQHRYS